MKHYLIEGLSCMPHIWIMHVYTKVNTIFQHLMHKQGLLKCETPSDKYRGILTTCILRNNIDIIKNESTIMEIYNSKTSMIILVAKLRNNMWHCLTCFNIKGNRRREDILLSL